MLEAGGSAAAWTAGTCQPSVLSQMSGPVGLILGCEHAAVMEMRHLWDGSSMRAWLSVEREEELGRGTAAVSSYPQQMETYHTLC